MGLRKRMLEREGQESTPEDINKTLQNLLGDPFKDAGEDVLVLLKRLGLEDERRMFKKILEK